MRLTITEQQQIRECINRIAESHAQATRKAMELLAEIKREQEQFEDSHTYVNGERLDAKTK